MGVDKACVRFVVHWGIPSSLPGYYQESGRAGRDGKPAFCRIYHSRSAKSSLDFILRGEGFRAKTAEKKAQAQATYKDFLKMVEYCECVRCRHGVFAYYFGDDKPECKDKCDVCKNPKDVEDGLQTFLCGGNKTTRTFAVTQADYDAGYDNLYGGGRRGQSRESESYANDSESSKEERKKTELAMEIKKQFALRRGSDSEKERSGSDFEEEAKHARVRAAASTKIKVNGLTLAARDGHVRFIQELLQKNLDQCSPVDPPLHQLVPDDVEQAALDLEYQAFSSSTAISVYRRAVAKMVADIKTATSKLSLHILLKSFEPQPKVKGTLSEAAEEEKGKIIKRKAADCTEFSRSGHKLEILKASQLITNNKVDSRDHHRKGLKRDSLFQNAIDSYFVKNPSKDDAENPDNSGHNRNKSGISSAAKDDSGLSLESTSSVENDTYITDENSGSKFEFEGFKTYSEKFKNNLTSKSLERSGKAGISKNSFYSEAKVKDNKIENKNDKDSCKNSFDTEDTVQIVSDSDSESRLFISEDDNFQKEDKLGWTVDDLFETNTKLLDDKHIVEKEDNNLCEFECIAAESFEDEMINSKLENFHEDKNNHFTESSFLEQIDTDKLHIGSKNNLKTRKKDISISQPKTETNMESVKGKLEKIIVPKASVERKVKTTGENNFISTFDDLFSPVSEENKSKKEQNKVEDSSQVKNLIDNEEVRIQGEKIKETSKNKSTKHTKKRKCVELFGEEDSNEDKKTETKKQKPLPDLHQKNKTHADKNCIIESERLQNKVACQLPKLEKSQDTVHPEKVEGSIASPSKSKIKVDVVMIKNNKANKLLESKDKQKEKAEKPSKQKLTDEVIKNLMPFYKKQRIASKDLFKYLARTVVHKIISDPPTECNQAIKKLIDTIFKNGTHIETQKQIDIFVD